jgi:hypothetical protein
VADDLSIPSPGIRSTSTSTTMRSSRYGAQQRAARPGMDPDVRRMALFAGGIGSLLAVLIGISTLTGRHSGEVPVIAPDARPIRVKPADPGGLKINTAANDVFSGGSDTSNARLAAPAETPDTAGLRTAAAEPSAPAAEATAPSAAQPAARIPPAPAPATTQPTAKPAPAPSTLAAGAHAVAKVAPIPVPAPKPAPAPTPTPAPATGRSVAVQLAALSTEQGARTEWQALAKRMPDLLGSRQPTFSRTEHEGRTFWRVRTSGFADVAEARSFCEKVQAKRGGCSVIGF